MNRYTTTLIFLTVMIMNSGCSGDARPLSSGGASYSRVRPMAVVNQFYPGDADTLSRWFGQWRSESPVEPLRAIIVPHAGYVFSGSTAMESISRIDPSLGYEHIFLLGPSHHVWIGGASVNNVNDAYATPFGPVGVDLSVGDSLIASDSCFTYRAAAHVSEHSLEVQLPMLKWWYDNGGEYSSDSARHAMPPIVPVIISSDELSVLRRIARALQPWFNERNLFVVSSDFSHYPCYDDARKVDSLTALAIESGSSSAFIQRLEENASMGIPDLATSACGEMSIAVLLMMMEADKSSRYEIKDLKYTNSGDSRYGDRDRVVGYHAFAVKALREGEGRDDAFLSSSAKSSLLRLARFTISDILGVSAEEPRRGSWADMKCGAFVTLHIGGRLRGCIGHFGGDAALWDVVSEMAAAAAFRDPRFPSLTRGELDSVKIEISVLTPLRRIYSIDDFHLHRDGIYIKKGARSGTFLPQVADEVDWTKEQFLGHCSRDKAGIGWDGWRDAELYTYQAIIFSED